MNRTVRTIIGVALVLVITFSTISVCQNLGKSIKIDVTEQNLYTLSDGTKAILQKLNQPVKVKLYYAETAALKGPDQIRYFNNYYQFVKSLLEEYTAAANGMIDLQIIDPRPFSEEEAQALRYGLKRFSITEEESFFFGLVVQTQFGVEKSIPFFSPDRQNFIEYDISSLIDTAITRQKTRIGIMSSLPVMGDEVSGYMAQMMQMQGQRPKPAWTFVEQLKNTYEVKSIGSDTEEIKDIDILLVIHPKDLPGKTLFAIDQFVLKNGRAIICVDPHCVVDQPDPRAMQMGRMPSQSSDLDLLFQTWGLEMKPNTFAGDRNLALRASVSENSRPETMIGFLNLVPGCFDTENVITADINQVRLLFSGVLNEKNMSAEDPGEDKSNVKRFPLLMTTSGGNSWSVSNPFELMTPNPSALMKKFVDGSEPVNMAYLVTGKLKTGFPEGIEITSETDEPESSGAMDDSQAKKETTKKLTGVKEAEEDCAVIVFADVDFISDMIAYQDTFLGKMLVGDNSTLMLNAIDKLGGSSDLISIRSRGNFKRPFTIVDAIEKTAEKETAAEEAKINAEIAGFQEKLQSILTSGEESEKEIVGSSLLQKKKELELNIHQAQRELRRVKMKRRERIERLGNLLQNFNMLMAPAVILIVAIVLGIRRSAKKRYYISHPGNSQ
ncbi:MAG: GldG family protein [Candidatus Brocadiaceae bacterium]|nr:GldG family protein [Candidatus Brocadiaceae bacterium]